MLKALRALLSIRFIAAHIVYYLGVLDAERLHTQYHARFYLVWDPRTRRLIPISYNFIRGRKDSYQYLRQRGVFLPTTRKELQDRCVYYTRSRKGINPLPASEKKLRVLRFVKVYCAR